MAVEKLLDLEVPRRGEWIRAIFTELQPHPQPPDLPRHRLGRPGRHRAALLLLPRARPRARPVRAGHGGVRMHPRYAPGRRRRRGPARRPSSARRAPFIKEMRSAHRRVRGPDRPAARSAATRTRGIGVITPEFARQMGLTGPNARASGVNWDLRARTALRRLPRARLQPIVLAGRRRLRPLPASACTRCAQSLDIIEQALDGLPSGPVDRRRPQGRAAAAPRAAHLDGVADPPLQARHRGLPRARRRGLRAASRGRAASSAATSSPTAPPSRGACTSARPASSCCSRSPRSARACCWPT